MIKIGDFEFYWITLLLIPIIFTIFLLTKKIEQSLFKNQKDKQLHVVVSFFMVIIFSLPLINIKPVLSVILSYIFTLLVGMIKEIIDPHIRHIRDIEDFKADLIGATGAFLIMLSIVLFLLQS